MVKEIRALSGAKSIQSRLTKRTLQKSSRNTRNTITQYRRSMGWTRARACPASERSSNGRWLPFITATVKARAGIRSTRIPLRGFAGVHEDGCACWLSLLSPRLALCERSRVRAAVWTAWISTKRHANHSFQNRFREKEALVERGRLNSMDGCFLINWFPGDRCLVKIGWYVWVRLEVILFFRISYSTISLIVINVDEGEWEGFDRGWSRLVEFDRVCLKEFSGMRFFLKIIYY